MKTTLRDQFNEASIRQVVAAAQLDAFYGVDEMAATYRVHIVPGDIQNFKRSVSIKLKNGLHGIKITETYHRGDNWLTVTERAGYYLFRFEVDPEGLLSTGTFDCSRGLWKLQRDFEHHNHVYFLRPYARRILNCANTLSSAPELALMKPAASIQTILKL